MLNDIISRRKDHAIVVCCTPNWLAPAACTLKSCIDQGSLEIADHYIVSMGVSDDDKKKLRSFLELHNCPVTLLETELPIELIENATKRFSAATFYRLTLDKMLDPTYRRILYLDADVLAFSSVTEIFELDLDGKCLGAVEDCFSFPRRFNRPAKHPVSLGMQSGSRYFNAGVLLFDWDKILKSGMLQKSIERILQSYKKGKSLKYHDQDALNLVFAGKWKPLPIRYNTTTFVADHFSEDVVLRHFTMDHKPWHKVRGIGYEKFRSQYQAMLKNTPWEGLTEKGPIRFAPIQGFMSWLRKHDTNAKVAYSKHLANE